MRYRSKSYQIDTPGMIWRKFKTIHDDKDRINGRVVELIALDVLHNTDDDIDDELQKELKRILGGETDGL